jgi:hypothetical protein
VQNFHLLGRCGLRRRLRLRRLVIRARDHTEIKSVFCPLEKAAPPQGTAGQIVTSSAIWRDDYPYAAHCVVIWESKVGRKGGRIVLRNRGCISRQSKDDRCQNN